MLLDKRMKAKKFSSIPREVEVVQGTNVIASLPVGIHLTKEAFVNKPQVLPFLIKVKHDKRVCHIK